MGYLPLADYKYAWFFKHRELVVDATDLIEIKPLDPKSAQTLWQNQ
ncbi:MAG: DUF2947 family protein, partial [Pseudomonadales bacterium]